MVKRIKPRSHLSAYTYYRLFTIETIDAQYMNLHIIGNTFVNIRINSFRHSEWFQIVRDC